MTDAERDAFLAGVRYGVLTTVRRDGSPVAVPVWFEWDGKAVRVFTSSRSAKVKRLERDPRASLLVVNHPHEPELWVAFDGTVTIEREGGLELAERLARRYWPKQDERQQQELAGWRAAAAHLVVLELTPSRIRSSKD